MKIVNGSRTSETCQRLHIPNACLRRATSTSPPRLPLRLTCHRYRTPKIQAPNPLHQITPDGIHRASGRQQTRCLTLALLDSKQPDTSVIPDARGALGDYHLACKYEAPEQGLVPAETKS